MHRALMDCAACEEEGVDPEDPCDPVGDVTHEGASVRWVLDQEPSTERAAWHLAEASTGSVRVADSASAAYMEREGSL